MNEYYKIIGVNLNKELINQINDWIFTKNKTYSFNTNLTTTIPHILIEIIDSLSTNRSQLLRECIENYLSSLNSIFQECKYPLFNSKGSFLRNSILHSILPKESKKIINVESKNHFWINFNGKLMKKDDFYKIMKKEVDKLDT